MWRSPAGRGRGGHLAVSDVRHTKDKGSKVADNTAVGRR